MHSWLQHGILQDSAQEFFVCKGEHLRSTACASGQMENVHLSTSLFCRAEYFVVHFSLTDAQHV
jgi:hypothetical protein